MRLACPSCSSLYDLPESFFAQPDGVGPRKVRCRTCSTVFLADPQVQPASADVLAEAPPDPSGDLPAGPDRRRAPRLAAATLGLAGGLVAGGLAALLALPGAPARLAADPRLPPALAGVVARLPGNGLALLAPRQSPLEVVARAARRPLGSGRVAFEVTGALSNPTRSAQGVAAIELRLADPGGQTVERRFIRLADPAVAPGGSASFATVALDVPAEATRVFLAVQPGPLARF